MKMKLILGLLFSIMLITQASAQPFGHWRTGGNPAIGLDGVNATNNTIGTIPNLPLRIITTNTQRIFISAAGTGIGSGQVVIGNNFNTPANRLHLFQAAGTFGTQYTSAATGSLATNGFAMNLVGSGLTAGEFHFRQFSNQND